MQQTVRLPGRFSLCAYSHRRIDGSAAERVGASSRCARSHRRFEAEEPVALASAPALRLRTTAAGHSETGSGRGLLYRSTRRPSRRTVWPSASPDSKDVQEACVRNARPGGNPGGADPRRARPIGAFRDLLVQRPRIGVRSHRGVPRRRHPHLLLCGLLCVPDPAGASSCTPIRSGPIPLRFCANIT